MIKENLIVEYIEAILQEMDSEMMAQALSDYMFDEINDNYSEQELIDEVAEYYPHLIEGVENA
jgi:acyl carrier protein phosphodiesterase